jgi:hypothetical protein
MSQSWGNTLKNKYNFTKSIDWKLYNQENLNDHFSRAAFFKAFRTKAVKAKMIEFLRANSEQKLFKCGK